MLKLIFSQNKNSKANFNSFFNPQMDDSKNTELLLSIINNETWSKSIDTFKTSKNLLFQIPNTTLQTIQSNTKHGSWILKILFLRNEIKNKNYSQANNFLELSLLEEKSAKLDFLISIIINFHFKISEKLNKIDSDLYFYLLFYHRELGHYECVSMLQVILLRISVICKKYFFIGNENQIVLNHQGIATFYYGVIHLNNGNYLQAFRAFKFSSILRSSIKTESFIIVTSLLLNEPYKIKEVKRLHSYLELQKSVKNGDIKKYELILTKFKEEFLKDGLFEIILRLKINVEAERFKKISRVYSRIKRGDLLKLGIKNELIKDFDEIINFKKEEEMFYDAESRIVECEELIEKMRGMMKYEEVPPLCVESLGLDVKK